MRITGLAMAGLLAAVVLVITISVIYVAYVRPVDGPCQSTGCVTLISQPGTSSSYTAQGGNMTVAAKYVPPPSAESTTTSAYITTSTYSANTQSPGGSYTYSPNPQVKVLSVDAVVSGNQYVTFGVQFQNTGSGTIYVLGGGGSSLDASILSGSNVMTQSQGPRCLVATAMVPVGPGGDHTSITPGCWSGYSYVLVQPGIVQVQLTLTWSSNSTSSQSNSIIINAEFALR